MRLEIRSALIGASVLGLLAVAIGWQNPTRREVVQIPAPATALGGPLQIDGIPTPGQLVRLSKLDGDLPFIVPAGKTLVITRAGLKAQDCTVIPQAATGVQRITIDGSCVWALFTGISGASQQYVYGMNLGPGIAAPEGTIVDVSGQSGSNVEAVILLGYLADA